MQLPERDYLFADRARTNGLATPIPERLIETPHPRIGMVIGTYASLQYIALQLECRRRFWPTLPLLIHDDSSTGADSLAEICQEYSAEFLSTKTRLGHGAGDLAAIVAGIDWAYENHIDLLVKISRRYLIMHDFVPGLCELAYNSQYTAYSNSCPDYGFRLRSECIAIHVPTWRSSDVMVEMRQAVADKRDPSPYMEDWYHDAAKRIHRQSAPMAVRRREIVYPRHPDSDAYGIWQMMGHGRQSRVPGVLWHDANLPEEYHEVATQWGLTHFTLTDFRKPNSTPRMCRPFVQDKDERPALNLEGAPLAPTALIPAHDGQASVLTPLDLDRALASAKSRLTDNTRIFQTIRKRSNLRGGAMPWNTYRRLRRFVRRDASYISLLNCCGDPWLVDLLVPNSVTESFAERSKVGVNRFVWRRLSEKKGALLALGLPTAMLVNATDCEQTGAFPAIVVGPAGDYLNWLGAVCALNRTRETQIWQGAEEGDENWLTGLPQLPLPKIGVVVIAYSPKNLEVLQSAAPLIKRDQPEIVLTFVPGVTGGNADDLAAILAFVENELNYEIHTVDYDGTFSDFPSSKHRFFAHAQSKCTPP